MCHPVFPGSLITHCACQTGAVPAVLPQPALGALGCSLPTLRLPVLLSSSSVEGGWLSWQRWHTEQCLPWVRNKSGREEGGEPRGTPGKGTASPHSPWGSVGLSGCGWGRAEPPPHSAPPPPNCRTCTQELLLSPSLAFLMTNLCECHEPWRPGRVGEIQYC